MILKDVIGFEGLKDAKIVAGEKGISNTVSSISVLEVAETKIKTWVLENQLYITSFYAIMQNVEKQKAVIHALHKKKSAGLVICHIDLFIKEVHKDIINLCNELGFPLIVANGERSYVEILNPVILRLMDNRDINNSIINMQNKLIEYIASQKDINYIYKTMTLEYGKRIIFLDINYKLLYPIMQKGIDDLIGKVIDKYNFIKDEYSKNGYSIIEVNLEKKIILPIQSNGLNYGIIIAEYFEEEFERSIDILRSIASLCTLVFTKNSRVLELESIRKQEYIGDLITWNFRSDEVAIKMGQDVGWDILNKCKMIIINLNYIQESVKVNTKDFNKFISEVLYGKIKDAVKFDNELNIIGIRSDIFVILLEEDNKATYERSKKLGNKILKICKESLTGSVSIGISKDIESYKHIPNAYMEAIDAAKIGRHFWGVDKVVNFEDIGFYGAFRNFLDDKDVKQIKKHTFNKLKKYDEETNQDLYLTLKSLVYNNMNTEKVSKELYLHKNTINYRKRKIVEVLGYEPWNMPYLLNTLITLVSDYFD